MGDKDEPLRHLGLFVVYDLAVGYWKLMSDESFEGELTVACEGSAEWFTAVVRPACQPDSYWGQVAVLGERVYGQ